jgi:DNA-binding NarL/FixJ family response regulator
MMNIRVIAIDDHPLILKQIVESLQNQPDIEVVGQGSHGTQLMPLVRRAKPHVVLLDLAMDEGIFEPIAAVRQLKQEFPHIQILVLTGHSNEIYVKELTEAGALGYVLKRDDLSLHLPDGVRAVYRGDHFHSPTVIKALLSKNPQHNFTEQELSVLRLTSKGLVNEKIGEALGVSEGRIRNILTQIYEKMNLQDDKNLNRRVAIGVIAREMGLLPYD